MPFPFSSRVFNSLNSVGLYCKVTESGVCETQSNKRMKQITLEVVLANNMIEEHTLTFMLMNEGAIEIEVLENCKPLPEPELVAFMSKDCARFEALEERSPGDASNGYEKMRSKMEHLRVSIPTAKKDLQHTISTTSTSSTTPSFPQGDDDINTRTHQSTVTIVLNTDNMQISTTALRTELWGKVIERFASGGIEIRCVKIELPGRVHFVHPEVNTAGEVYDYGGTLVAVLK